MGIKGCLIATLSFLGLTLFGHPGDALATIYRCGKDPELITLTNEKPTKDCKKMVLPSPDKRAKKDKASQNKSANQSGALSGKDADKQSSKKTNHDAAITERRRIITEELELERSRLEIANERVRMLERIPKLSSEQQKELLDYQKKQGLHQANVDLLAKELKKQK